MRGSDMVTAWVKDGRLFLQDRYGIDEGTPLLDDHPDWRPLYAQENDTHTVLVVARDINTCDPHDYVLTNDSVRMIYAWGEEDPTGPAPPYHGPRRGNRYALVLLPFHRQVLPTEAQVWTVKQKVTLPHTQDTFYWCHIEKIPKWETKHHYIGFDMIYGKNSRENLHHSVAFECHSNDGSDPGSVLEKHLDVPGYECYTPNMPSEFYLCERFLINWAIGSEGELLPERVGYPLGDLHGGATYIMFQTHYDNRRLERDVTVEWGMNIYYTDKLREIDASNMGLGHALLFSLTVPPRTPHWLVSGHCPSECTAATIPPDGINVFTVFIHGHYLARAIRLRHFRKGVELPPLAEDKHYAADFQQSRRLTKEVKILPGDHLTVECDYDSTGRAKGTFTGWKAEDEMCQAFINYYPRVDLALCRSSPHPRLLQDTFGLGSFQEDLNLDGFEFDPEVGAGQRYQEVMNSLPWDTMDKTTLNTKVLQGDQVIKCQYNYGIKMKLDTNVTRYPRATPFVPPSDLACAALNLHHVQGASDRASAAPLLVLVLVALTVVLHDL
ncbi:DBH-like monooxygenase protein 1 isoform X2 [Procambarus clarkii]|nr:DBH-like monooxygenase protein 1 isoform X2 [Procambarus clarkii]